MSTDWKSIRWPDEPGSKWGRITRLDDETCEVIEGYSGHTADAVILAREACARLEVDGLREIHIKQDTGKSRIEVRVRA